MDAASFLSAASPPTKGRLRPDFVFRRFTMTVSKSTVSTATFFFARSKALTATLAFLNDKSVSRRFFTVMRVSVRLPLAVVFASS